MCFLFDIVRLSSVGDLTLMKDKSFPISVPYIEKLWCTRIYLFRLCFRLVDWRTKAPMITVCVHLSLRETHSQERSWSSILWNCSAGGRWEEGKKKNRRERDGWFRKARQKNKGKKLCLHVLKIPETLLTLILLGPEVVATSAQQQHLCVPLDFARWSK